MAFRAILVLAIVAAALAAKPWMNANLTPEQRAQALLAQMTLEEKIVMVHGQGTQPYVGNIPGNKRLGIPALTLEDGPQGVADGVLDVTAWPSGLSVTASWDVELMKLWGIAMGEEQLYKGTNIMLGPMFNLNRVPLAGRNFESFGEDPHLAGQMARAQIIGIQSKGIMACAKHYVDNSQEYERTTVSEDVPERAQYELYYPAFKASVDAGVLSVMCSYNKINSTWACENPTVMKALKQEMGYKYFVMSDWGATHSTVAAANAGLDQEMPDSDFFGKALEDAVKQGTVPQSRVDDMVFRILDAMFTIGLFDREPIGNLSVKVNTEAHRRLTRDISSQSTVLLKNEPVQGTPLLPINPLTVKRIAVIGDDASINGISTGGGSGNVQLPYMASVYGGIMRRVGYSRTRNCTQEKDIDYFQPGNPRYYARSAAECCAVCDADLACRYWTFVPPSNDCWLKETDAGRRAAADRISGSCGTVKPAPQAQVTYTPSSDIQAAVAAAKAAEIAIISVGTTSSEGIDRTDLNLPDAALIAAVAAAQPRTLVVVHTPAHAVMPWANQVPAIITNFLPGQENGNALAQVLFGDVNPSGRLPITMPGSESDTWIKTKEQYPGVNGHAAYSEELLVGYRWYSTKQIKPAFMFGHGLSYTTFRYSDFVIEPSGQDVFVRATVTNVGDRPGAEVSQLYLQYPAAAGEPIKQLRGFAKNYLLPGQSTDLEFLIKSQDRAIWDVTKHAWSFPFGTFTAYLGSTFDNTPMQGSFTF